MGRLRGQRNAAKEKVWPGERSDKLRDAKRDYERFCSGGKTNWRAIEAAANELLPDIPTIEWKETIQSKIVINIGGTRRFTPPRELELHRKAIDSVNHQLKHVDEKFKFWHEKSTIKITKPPAPLRKTPIVSKPLKNPTPGNKCDRCGGPRGGAPQSECVFKDTKHYCSACFRLNAADRRNDLLKKLNSKPAPETVAKDNRDKIERIKIRLNKRLEDILPKYQASKIRQAAALDDLQEQIDGYLYWVDYLENCAQKELPNFDGGNAQSQIAINKIKEGTSITLIRLVPDFSLDLIDEISEIEEAYGKPYFAIPAELDRPRKSIFHSNDSFERMAGKQMKPTIRYRRPKWKTIRGEWA